jgi:predicted cupin superfamily sugar epimerase
MSPEARAIIERLSLSPHPEGGFFRETFRAPPRPEPLEPGRGGPVRAASTAIYFLLPASAFSAFHSVSSDEAWHWYDGDPLELHVIAPNGEHDVHVLGRDLVAGQRPQHVVPAGLLQAARPRIGARGFSLCGCTVAPGFDFADFVMPERATLTERFPAHATLIERFTRA